MPLKKKFSLIENKIWHTHPAHENWTFLNTKKNYPVQQKFVYCSRHSIKTKQDRLMQLVSGDSWRSLLGSTTCCTLLYSHIGTLFYKFGTFLDSLSVASFIFPPSFPMNFLSAVSGLDFIWIERSETSLTSHHGNLPCVRSSYVPFLYALPQLEEMFKNENKILFTLLCKDFRFWMVKNLKMICLFSCQKHACAQTQTSTVTVLGVVFPWHGHVMERKTVLMVQMKAQMWVVWEGIPQCAHQTSSGVQTFSALMRYVQQNKITLEF